MKNSEKEKVRNHKKNNNFKKAFENRSKPYFSEIINNDDIPPPNAINEVSNIFLGDLDIKRDRYFSIDFANLEEKYIWNKVWQFACREEDIPSIGDYYVYDILDWSILMLLSILAFTEERKLSHQTHVGIQNLYDALFMDGNGN